MRNSDNAWLDRGGALHQYLRTDPMREYRSLGWMAVILLLSARAWGFESLVHYLDEFACADRPVFLCQCRGDNGSRVVLVIDMVEARGLFVEARDGVVVNVASLRVEKERVALLETQGGVASYARVQQLVDSMARSSFRMLTRAELGNAAQTEAAQECTKSGTAPASVSP